MLVRTLLGEVDSMYIKHLIPEKDRTKGREMVTLSDRRMLNSSQPPFTVKLTIPTQKSGKD